MSIEEKARAYDEALERAQDAANKGMVSQNFVDDIFSELKESEDERIRKNVLKTFRIFMEKQAWVGHVLDDIDWDECIAWLEKQKPVEWSEEDESVIKDVIDKLNRRKMTCFGRENEMCDREIKWLKSLSHRLRTTE